DRITSGTYDGQERKATSLDATSGVLTVLAHGGAIASAVTYEVHRMFSAAEKKRALLQACKTAFPDLHKVIRDTSKTVGNWLLNGDVELWTVATYPDSWLVSSITATKTTTAGKFWRGSVSCLLNTAAGYLYQSNTQNPDLMQLAGESVTFKAPVWCDTASDCRLSIYDGTTTTYSGYHTGGSVKEDMTVTATIADEPSQIRFAVHKAGASGSVYVDDLRVIGPDTSKIYIGDLGLALNYPHVIEQTDDDSIMVEPWTLIRNYDIGSDGYLYLHEGNNDYRLRISGIGYLDFLLSGVASEAWAATVAIDSPQTLILSAEAVMYLYTQMIMPNATSGERDQFAKILQYWQAESQSRKNRFGMKVPAARVSWGI
ncbi:MAG: hypothetical protein IMZ61_12390, partial [Planctomycetes bacterium]|nr:hypothetical protein [Planctomycetota bacterium]